MCHTTLSVACRKNSIPQSQEPNRHFPRWIIHLDMYSEVEPPKSNVPMSIQHSVHEFWVYQVCCDQRRLEGSNLDNTSPGAINETFRCTSVNRIVLHGVCFDLQETWKQLWCTGCYLDKPETKSGKAHDPSLITRSDWSFPHVKSSRTRSQSTVWHWSLTINCWMRFQKYQAEKGLLHLINCQGLVGWMRSNFVFCEYFWRSLASSVSAKAARSKFSGHLWVSAAQWVPRKVGLLPACN